MKELYVVEQELGRLRQKNRNQKRELRRLNKITAGYYDALRVQREVEKKAREDEKLREFDDAMKKISGMAAGDQLSFAFGQMIRLEK